MSLGVGFEIKSYTPLTVSSPCSVHRVEDVSSLSPALTAVPSAMFKAAGHIASTHSREAERD